MSKRRSTNPNGENSKIRRTSADGHIERTNSSATSSSPVAVLSGVSSGAGQGELGFGVTLQRQCSVTLNNISSYVERSKEILSCISQFLEDHPQLCDQTKLDNWRKDLCELDKKTSLPETVVAVVGATGSGKSSLVNALVDHDKLLPTSSMRACTAVPVEVTENDCQRYEAEIEFLSKEEWSAELELLKTLLTGKDGTIKYSRTNPSFDVTGALAKVVSVYGPLDWGADWNKYTEENDVTRLLSQTIHVLEKEAEAFRYQIDKYIKAREDEDEYWPIVRHVRIKIPKCDVCHNGAVIVDLPGTGDSNPARNSISEKFRKDCHAMFVVANITRAVDDEAAKKLLGPRFRQKLLLDGQYGNISFICTQTDQIDTEDIISELHLVNRLKPISDKKKERQKNIESLKSQERMVETRIKEEIHRIENGDIQDECQKKKFLHQKELESIKNQIAEQKEEKKELQREETVFCINARNEYCTTRIKKDFIAGLKETRLAENPQNDKDDDEDDDDESDVEDGEPMNTSLRVFSVSAKQYLKMTGDQDDEEQIFKDAQDTQIPHLKEFVQKISSEKQNHAAVSLLRSIRTLARDICHYTEASAGEHMHMQNKAITDKHMEKLHKDLKQSLNEMMEKIREKFHRLIRKLSQGAGLAVTRAEETQRNWGSKPGGYTWNTYQTTCVGSGFYRPRKKPEVDFNWDLAEPMYSSIKVAWDDIFNHQLNGYLQDYMKTFASMFMAFASDLSKAVKLPGTPEDVTYLNCLRKYCAHSDKLYDSVDNVWSLIRKRQRAINPILIEKVKEHMQPAYNSCKFEVGKGMFDRMKNHMDCHVRENMNQMCHEAQVAMKAELDALVEKISSGLQDSLDVLLEDFRHQSWWEPSPDTDTVSEYETEARSIKEEIEQMCTEARIPEHLLPAVSLPGAGLVP